MALHEAGVEGWRPAEHEVGVMGWSFNGPEVEFQFEGVPAQVHPDGNNVAWCCPDCGHPIIFVYRLGRSGSSANDATECRGCGSRFYLEPPFGHRQEPIAGVPEVPAPLMLLRRGGLG